MLEFAMGILLAAGSACALAPRGFRTLSKALALAGSLAALAAAAYGVLVRPYAFSYTGFFAWHALSGLTALGAAFFCFLGVVYTFGHDDNIERLPRYYAYTLLAAAFASAAAFSTDIILLTVFWGLSGLMLYLLANLFPQASNAAKKSFIFAGGSDALMVLGITIYIAMTGTTEIYGGAMIPLSGASPAAVAAFACLVIAALTKAGAMPFHSWVPDFAAEVPYGLSAYLPGALDKLLGVFLLFITCHQLFAMNFTVSVILLAAGAFTALAGIYMAFNQRDMRRFLAYSTVSQMGYMVLGIAAGTAIGVAGAVLHMLNNTIYKSALFFTGGAVEKETGSSSFDRLGGLSKHMPLTFAGALVASLSIAGVPPFSGFASKWMIYQGLFQRLANPTLETWVRACFAGAMVLAMFGSALTLAAYMKFIHSVFLGQPSPQAGKAPRETNIWGLAPVGLLAALCVVFGLFAYTVPLRWLVIPAVFPFGFYFDPAADFWKTGPALVVLLSSLALGLAVWLASRAKMRRDRPFTGSEDLPPEGNFEGAEFYKSVTSELPLFRKLYDFAEKKYFDIYNLITKFVLGLGGMLSALHTGSIRTYILWFLLGFAVIFYVFARSL